MNKAFFLFLCLFLAARPVNAEEAEPLNFSILFHTGIDYTSGFLGAGPSLPEGGFWLGVGLSDRFDGLWGIDYYSLPGQIIPVTYGTPTNPVSIINPTDDVALSVNIRWYWADKYDFAHQRFNAVPYFVGGIGMDLMVDQAPAAPPLPGTLPPPATPFYNKSFEVLFGVNLGAGMDIPLNKQWFIYAEGLDHLVVWESLTQVFSIGAGFKVMLDSAHVDPFREH